MTKIDYIGDLKQILAVFAASQSESDERREQMEKLSLLSLVAGLKAEMDAGRVTCEQVKRVFDRANELALAYIDANKGEVK